MNTFMNELQNATNYKFTENGALTHSSTLSGVMDLFALGGAYRRRSDDDCILLFKNAFEEDRLLALKTLFYLRDVRGGQGERRFFRVCYKWLANNYPDVARKNLELLPEYGRYDDLIYAIIDTPIEADMFAIVKHQLALDVECNTPSLMAKWLPSENCSSKETKRVAGMIRNYLNMTHKEYRKMLSVLRSKINVLEKLMSANRWSEIEFDKIPSKAGLVYRNAFSRRDILSKKYEAFIKDKKTTVNAEVLNPVDIAHRAFNMHWSNIEDVDRMALDKYWSNLKDYYNGREENGLCIVDVSGSMSGQPMEAAISMGAYIAERGYGPFANHFVTFSSHPELVKFEGVDITDKFWRCRQADWGMNTDIKAVFDMLLRTAKSKHVNPKDMPTRLYIFSDMEFDVALGCGWRDIMSENKVNTLLESIAQQWAREGYELPQVIFWNLDARNNNIPAIGGRFAYVSGFSMNMIECILSGKDGLDLMLEKLNSDRYKNITI